MPDVQIKLAAIWAVVMLIYLWGDVLRIISGDFSKQMEGREFTQTMLLGIAILMLIPILMIFLSLTLAHPVNRWANIIVAVVFLAYLLKDISAATLLKSALAAVIIVPVCYAFAFIVRKLPFATRVF